MPASLFLFLQGRFYLKNRQKPTATLIYTDNNFVESMVWFEQFNEPDHQGYIIP